MDYKYIEQLLERYWACETTLQEEQILRTFFRQEDIPAQLAAYKDIFAVQNETEQAKLGDDFDAKMLKLVHQDQEEPVSVQARRITFASRLRPFYKAASIVAILLTFGMAAQHSLQTTPEESQTQVANQQLPEDPDAQYTQMPDAASATSVSQSTAQAKDSLSSALDEQTEEVAQ